MPAALGGGGGQRPGPPDRQGLVAAGEPVVDVPAKLAARELSDSRAAALPRRVHPITVADVERKRIARELLAHARRLGPAGQDGQPGHPQRGS